MKIKILTLFLLGMLLLNVGCSTLTSSSNSDNSGGISSINAPTGLVINPTKVSIQLAWDSDSTVSGYDVYRSKLSLLVFEKIATVSSPGFTDTVLSPNVTYVYKIKSLAGEGVESEFSNSITGVIVNTDKPEAPKNFSFTFQDGALEISFSSLSEDVAYFDVYRSTSSSAGFVKVNTRRVLRENNSSPIRGLFLDHNWVSGTTYFYKVKAVDLADIESDFSSVNSFLIP